MLQDTVTESWWERVPSVVPTAGPSEWRALLWILTEGIAYALPSTFGLVFLFNDTNKTKISDSSHWQPEGENTYGKERH